MLKIVIDTNIWISILLGGRFSLPVLEVWKENKFQLVISHALLDELDEVCQRPRLKKYINAEDAKDLLEQLSWKGLMTELSTIPPRCRDPKDHPVLATAIDGQADAIISGDADLHADDKLKSKMADYGVEIWDINMLLTHLSTVKME